MQLPRLFYSYTLHTSIGLANRISPLPSPLFRAQSSSLRLTLILVPVPIGTRLLQRLRHALLLPVLRLRPILELLVQRRRLRRERPHRRPARPRLLGRAQSVDLQSPHLDLPRERERGARQCLWRTRYVPFSHPHTFFVFSRRLG